MRNDFLNIWVVGTYASQLEGIGLDLYKCRYVTTEDIEGENINHLNRFVNEFVCQWYVYKNNIKSDYVSFCHYRRQHSITKIVFPELKKGRIQYFYRFFIPKHETDMSTEFPFFYRNKYMPPFMLEDLGEYLKTQKLIPIEDIKRHCTPAKGQQVPFYNREAYACRWEEFCGMMEFVCGYYDFICKKYNLNTREDWIRHISENIIGYHKSFGKEAVSRYSEYSLEMIYQRREDYLHIFDEDEGLNSFCNNWRLYAYMIEDLIGLYIGTHKRVCAGEINSGHIAN
jgi:hypothetical protein